MKHKTIVLNLLNEAGNSKFVIRKRSTANDQTNANYDAWNGIIKTKVLKSNLCDYSDAYILLRGDITIIGCDLATEVAFKNYAPFTKFITKSDETTIDDADDLDLVMLMNCLLE